LLGGFNCLFLKKCIKTSKKGAYEKTIYYSRPLFFFVALVLSFDDRLC
jgi:hypothetical protein